MPVDGKERFSYGVSRFWEKYGGETLFPTLDGASNEKSGFDIVINRISIFRHLLKTNFFLLLTLFRFLGHLEDF